MGWKVLGDGEKVELVLVEGPVEVGVAFFGTHPSDAGGVGEIEVDGEGEGFVGLAAVKEVFDGGVRSFEEVGVLFFRGEEGLGSFE